MLKRLIELQGVFSDPDGQNQMGQRTILIAEIRDKQIPILYQYKS